MDDAQNISDDRDILIPWFYIGKWYNPMYEGMKPCFSLSHKKAFSLEIDPIYMYIVGNVS